MPYLEIPIWPTKWVNPFAKKRLKIVPTMFFIGWDFDLHDNIYRSRAVFWTVPTEQISQEIEVSPELWIFLGKLVGKPMFSR